MTNLFTELIQSLKFADLVDIAIITTLIYVILIWFKAAASRFVFLGILILGGVYLFARFFQMYLTAVVLQAFFAILLIALVIIFQEELRRFFERLSIWGTMQKGTEVFSVRPEIDTITYALCELARKKIGALVVIRGDDPLGRHLEGGFELNGRISEPILASIFDPHSPGHDGAAVIEQGRIVRFACHLPLSANVRQTHDLGTRHSAALGLAERTDALCVVVSEERGTISVTRDERLRELDDPSFLQDELTQFYREKFSREKKRSWRNWIRENSLEKAVALALSCALWFVLVFQSGTLRRDIVVPIEYRNSPTGWVMEEPKLKEATVTLLGRTPAFDLLDERTLKITLDVSNLKDGTQEVPLTADVVSQPASLSVIEIRPQTVSLTAHQLITFNMPIEVRTQGALPAGYMVGGIKVVPESVAVKIGSAANSGSLKVSTEPIDLKDMTRTTTVTPQVIPPKGGEFADGKPPRVEVTIDILKSGGG